MREKMLLGTEMSRRTVLRAGAAAACAAALPGCANVIAGGAKYDASDLSANPTLLVATTRKPVGGARAEPWFGSERGTLSAARVKLTPPDGGRFSLASIGLDNWRIDAVERLADVGDLFRLAPRRDLLLYVHGYNTTFEVSSARRREALRRHSFPRPHDGVYLAVAGQAPRLRL